MSPEAIEIMDDTLIEEINIVVDANDTLWHLGDFCMYYRDEEDLAYYNRVKKYRDRIRCKNLKLVWGNHDERWIADLFSETYDLIHTSIPGASDRFSLCHYAMAIWPKSHRKSMHLYGHSHSEAEPWLDKIMEGRRAMDVGVDNAAKLLGFYRPFGLNEIMDLIGDKPGHSIGDHHVK